MCDPASVPWLIGSCINREFTVECPACKTRANVTAARWKTHGGQDTPWTVVDCSLLPAGQMCCHMACLAEIEAGQD
jgi:hypothetical protein